MPHFPKPYYKAKRRTWYVEVDRVQHLLGKHPEGLPEPKKGKNGWEAPEEIRQAYHKKMAELSEQVGQPGQSPLPVPANAHPFVACILDDFVGWLRNRVEEGSKGQRTLDWYADYLTSFLEHLRGLEKPQPEVPTMTVEQLMPDHVYAWVDGQERWKTSRRGAIVAVQRAFNWAAKAGKLRSLGGRSPLAGMEKPPQGRRELVIAPQQFTEAVAAVKDQEFRDLLTAAWETGARPNELYTVEASFLDEANARWVFPIRLSKGRKVQRVIYLTDRALEIALRLSAARPKGPIFRNTDGKPWNMSSVKCRFQNLRITQGRKRVRELGLEPPSLPRLKAVERADPARRREQERKVLTRRRQITLLAKEHGPRYNLYAFRHSFVTEALIQGLDAVTVSVLVGHRDTTMISRHYAHLTDRHDHLREAATRARGSSV
jgi:integrase